MKLKNIQPAIIISFIFIFGSFAFFALASDSLSQKQAVFEDSDKDGLSDDEESVYGTDPTKADSDGDGYSDGVEVRSGYDPLKPAPGDKISVAPAVLGESATNGDDMTSQLSEKFAQFIEENKDKEGALSVEDLDVIIQDALGEELEGDEPISIDESLIRIKEQNYEALSAEERRQKENEDARAYFKSILYILISNIPGEVSSEEDLSAALREFSFQLEALFEGSANQKNDYFDDLTARGKLILGQISLIEVPEQLLELHKEGLLFLARALELNKLTINVDDAIGLIVNVSKIQSVVEQGSVFQQNFILKMNECGIESGFDLIFNS